MDAQSIKHFLLDPVDLYCERTGPGFWAEPLNFLSNLAFLLAAWRIFYRASRAEPSRKRNLYWLGGMSATVGIGSGLFHSIPSHLTQIADVGPIAIYVAACVWFYFKTLHEERGLEKKPLLLCLAFLTILPLIAHALGWAPYLANGEFYLGLTPALLTLAFFESDAKQKRSLYGTSLAFLIAYGARTLDPPLCEGFPLGTHWIWHLMTATVAYRMASLQSFPRRISSV